ncbi:uncharacterized protein KQ657_001536 [Scheffersomyces spartinae]|uniref:RRM domain-containing protein n=1 Tax=Scheffersomyces spartinae TaxID=45513 RepID=A0A9P7V7Y7_9ASCO|nr:uncharacterized protein KQ657_001536 [Scheffersomyces spartinae]KAG7192753.1 hypothetical protein KQ657_001536 [Scheffersomyces spartinae]
MMSSSLTNEGGDNRMGFQHKNHQQSHFGGREMQRNNYSSFYNRNNNSSQQRYSGDTRNQLWMGDIDPVWDEEAIMNIWKLVGFQPTNVKIMRDRNADKAYKGRSDYCFVSFPDPQAVLNAIQKNGTQIPDTQRVFKLNWTNQSNHQLGDPGMRNHNPNSQTGGGQFSKGGKPEFSLFVGDLGGDVTDELLYEAFEKAFPNQILQARVMYDPTTKQSKGFGFVKVTNQTIQSNAITEMSGFVINGRPIRVGLASGGANRGGPITSTSSTSTTSSKFNTIENDTIPILQQYQPPLNQFTDPNNTTLVVKGLSSKVSEDELSAYFIAFGDIVLCKLSYDLNTGYVKFLTREAAENAILHMHGITICGCRLVVTWGIINLTTDEIIQPPEYQKCPPPPGVAGKLGPINMCFHKLTKEELLQLDFFRDNEPLTVPQSNKLYIARQSKVHTILDEALL